MNEPKSGKQWIEFSILVDQDLAEMVGNALMGILPAGLASERVFDGVFPHELDQVTGPVRIFGFYPKEDDLEFRKQIRESLKGLRAKIDLPDPVFSSLVNRNWAAAWQERYQPIPLGEKLIVVPSWLENPDPERIPIYIDPGMAFGSGVHATTQLSMILLESCLLDQPSSEVIDVGCGSGILSIAAAKLGVNKILGVDSDSEAIHVSEENAIKNGVKSTVNFSPGSVLDILTGKLPLSSSSLVVANIIAPILQELFEVGLGDLVASNGFLVLSGILEEQQPAILNCLDRDGFKVKTRLQQGEWVGFLAEKIQA